MSRYLSELKRRLTREQPRALARGIRWKIHSFALGMTLALAVPLVAQGCVAGGQ